MSEEVVMAGDGGRAPDVSEQRADVAQTRDPEQQALEDAHSHARDLSLCLDALGLVPDAQKYAHAINLAAHLTSALTAADAHRRFCEAEGIQRSYRVIQ
jgi:hypothetical protein